MSRAFDIMSIFNPNAQGNPVAPKGDEGKPVQQQQQQQQNQPDAFARPDATDDKSGGGQKAPLDKYNDLFKNDPEADKNRPDPNAPFFDMDPEKMQAEVGKMNFLADPGVQEKLATAMKTGDASAMAEAMNTAMQQVFLRGVQLSANVADKATRTGLQRFESQLPGRVRDLSAGEQLTEINPVFDHPAMAPMVNALKAQFQRKNPNASAKQIAGMVNDYLTDASSQLSGTPKPGDRTDHRTVDGNNDNFAGFFGFGGSQ